MSDANETQPYEAALITKSDELETKKFARLTDAIMWLSAQFIANSSNAEQGVVFYDRTVIWRKRNYPLPDENPALVPARPVPTETKSPLAPPRDEDSAD